MNGVRLPLHGKFTPAIGVAFPRQCRRHFDTGNKGETEVKIVGAWLRREWCQIVPILRGGRQD
jgi:hypothetical protein